MIKYMEIRVSEESSVSSSHENPDDRKGDKLLRDVRIDTTISSVSYSRRLDLSSTML
jgi:hypothetical protein